MAAHTDLCDMMSYSLRLRCMTYWKINITGNITPFCLCPYQPTGFHQFEEAHRRCNHLRPFTYVKPSFLWGTVSRLTGVRLCLTMECDVPFPFLRPFAFAKPSIKWRTVPVLRPFAIVKLSIKWRTAPVLRPFTFIKPLSKCCASLPSAKRIQYQVTPLKRLRILRHYRWNPLTVFETWPTRLIVKHQP